MLLAATPHCLHKACIVKGSNDTCCTYHFCILHQVACYYLRSRVQPANTLSAAPAAAADYDCLGQHFVYIAPTDCTHNLRGTPDLRYTALNPPDGASQTSTPAAYITLELALWHMLWVKDDYGGSAFLMLP